MKILRMVHIKKKEKKRKEILKKKKKKINSDVGGETKARDVGIQEEAHYGGGIQKSKDFTCREENTWQLGVGGPAGCKEQIG